MYMYVHMITHCEPERSDLFISLTAALGLRPTIIYTRHDGLLL